MQISLNDLLVMNTCMSLEFKYIVNIIHNPTVNSNTCKFLFPDRAFPKNVIDLLCSSSSHQNNPVLPNLRCSINLKFGRTK